MEVGIECLETSKKSRNFWKSIGTKRKICLKKAAFETQKVENTLTHSKEAQRSLLFGLLCPTTSFLGHNHPKS